MYESVKALMKHGRAWMETRLLRIVLFMEWKDNTSWQKRLRAVLGRWQPGVLKAGWCRWLWYKEHRQKAKTLIKGLKAVEKALCDRNKWFNMLSVRMLTADVHTEERVYMNALIMNWYCNSEPEQPDTWMEEDGICRYLTPEEINAQSAQCLYVPGRNVKIVFV